MTTDDPLRALWRDQPTATIDPATLDELRTRGDRMRKKTRERNVAELVAGAVVMLVFSAYAVHAEQLLERVGWWMTVAGVLLVLVTLWRRGWMPPAPPLSEPSSVYLAYYRAQLTRERDLLARAWLWYVLPPVPGMMVAFASTARGLASTMATRPNGLFWLASTGFVVLAGFVFIAWLNKRAAKKIDRELTALTEE